MLQHCEKITENVCNLTTENYIGMGHVITKEVNSISDALLYIVDVRADETPGVRSHQMLFHNDIPFLFNTVPGDTYNSMMRYYVLDQIQGPYPKESPIQIRLII